MVRLGGGLDIQRDVLDGIELREATYALKKLQGEHRRVLPCVVDNPTAWAASMHRLLELLKPWVHRDRPLPSSLFEVDGFYPAQVKRRAETLRRRQPRLESLIAAVSWVFATTPDQARKHLGWLADNAAELRDLVRAFPGTDGWIMAIQLANLARELGAPAVAPLVSLAAAARRCPHAMRDAESQLARLGTALDKAKPFPTPPASALPAEVRRSVAWLVDQDARVQRRFLGLLALVDVPAVAGAWRAWWPELRAVISKGEGLRRGYLDRRERAERFAQLRARVDTLRPTAPTGLKLAELGDALRRLSSPESDDWYEPACAALRSLDATRVPALRGAFVIHWVSRADSADAAERKRLPALLRSFADHVAAGGDLSPWRDTVLRGGESGCGQYTLDSDLLELEVEDIRHAFAAFAAFGDAHPGTPLARTAARIIDLVEACGEAELAAELMDALFEHKMHTDWYREATLRCAVSASAGRPDMFCDVLRSLERLAGDSELLAEEIYKPLSQAFAGFETLLPLLLRSQHSREVASCARKVALLDALGHRFVFECRPAGDAGAFIDDYPTALRPSLSRLGRASADAEAIARRLTASTIRRPEAIRAELAALRQRVATETGEQRERQLRRIANLERRLHQPKPLPEAKLGKLARRLDIAAARELLRAANERLDAQLSAARVDLLGTDARPAWLFDDANLAVIGALFELDPSVVQLAKRLLAVRCGPRPWDLRDHPANATFLASLAEQGIDSGPWVDGIGSMRFDTVLGPIELSLEDDPLEVFRMGGHFGTCLSPGQMNFFSVVANAADINKRVLYARSAKGVVVGRRLLCLTSQGGIVAFNAYCHDDDYHFDNASTEFVNHLATAMQTTTVPRGRIPELVACDWYDDGAVDIGNELWFLETGYNFRDSLTTIDVNEFLSWLPVISRQLCLEEFVVPPLVGLPELKGRPDLVASLALNLDLSRVPAPTCLHIALALEAANQLQAVDSLCARVADHVRERFRTEGGYDHMAASFVARHRPSMALRLLRETRDRGVRSWADEYRADRLEVAGTAMLGLNRHAQARKLFECAARSAGSPELRKAAAQRARELQARLDSPRTSRL